MVCNTELRRWRKYRSQSQAMLRPACIFGSVGTLVLLALAYFAKDRTSSWGWWLVLLGTVWFGFVGDWINIRYLDRRIAAAEEEQGRV